MNSIPFLQLPFLVIQDVLSIMNPFELIHLAKVSKRTKQIVKVILRTKLLNKYHAEIYISDDYGTVIKNGSDSWYYMSTSDRNNPNYIFTDETGNDTSTVMFLQNFTLNKLDHFQRICDLCHDLFGEFKGIDMDLNNSDSQLVIDFLKTKQESFEGCKVWSTTGRNYEIKIKHLLESFEITKHMRFSPQIPENLEINLPENVEKMFVYDARFIKLEQLLAMKSKQIVLFSTKFNNQDITAILKGWNASESNLNLEHLRIDFGSTATDEILQDIPNEIGDAFQVDDGFGKMTSVSEGPDVERDDGKKARVILWAAAGRATVDMYIH
ncbi:hypothetical protein CAEBREN_03489 [Caenorhabditis brenneri]|uniref:F-box domain-containing protein n=1 Tax=Caenorhabditis brenneri TaxID=135651 RepID=G0N6X8_CAEBE|nr:hypothetical protein CAEBREN_03489 [Caenorhabditis brenneri]